MKFSQEFINKYLGIALGGIVFFAVAPSIVSAKPLSPVQVSITAEQTIEPGQAVEFVVRASVTMDAENVQIIVSVPASLSVLGGDLQWQGPLVKGQEKQLRFTASFSESPVNVGDDPLIQVYAAIRATTQARSIQSDDHTRLAANAFYRWQTGVSRAASAQDQPLHTRVVERHGIKIQEYQLRP